MLLSENFKILNKLTDGKPGNIKYNSTLFKYFVRHKYFSKIVTNSYCQRKYWLQRPKDELKPIFLLQINCVEKCVEQEIEEQRKQEALELERKRLQVFFLIDISFSFQLINKILKLLKLFLKIRNHHFLIHFKGQTVHTNH